MAKIVKVRNGATAAKKNGAKRRNGTTKAGALSYAKKNGLKLVSAKTLQNGRKRKRGRRRNGLATAKGFISTRRNGIFGNTKSDVKQVMSLGGGALATKLIGRGVTGIVAPYASQVGGGKFTEIAVDAALGLFLIPMLASKIAGPEGAKFARLGALLVIALDGIELAAPDLLAFNPFNTSPIVIGGDGQVGLKPRTVAQLVTEVGNSPVPAAAAAKVAGAMMSADSGGYADMGNSNYSPMPLAMQ